MPHSRWSLILASCCGFAVLTLLYAAPEPPAANPDQPFHARLLEIATKYKAAPFAVPVDGHVPRWAPELCRMPEAGKDFIPSKPRTSASKDADTHGQKLYFLYAKDQSAYLDLGACPRNK